MIDVLKIDDLPTKNAWDMPKSMYDERVVYGYLLRNMEQDKRIKYLRGDKLLRLKLLIGVEFRLNDKSLYIPQELMKYRGRLAVTRYARHSNTLILQNTLKILYPNVKTFWFPNGDLYVLAKV